MQKKREKSEDFVGWKNEEGLLEVVSIYGRDNRRVALFKVICHKCKEDKELFPLGYFIGLKGDLIRNKKPCGCSKNPQWTKEQFLILSRRVAKDRFIVHGFAEEFHGAHTKMNIECLIDGYRWTTSINNIMNGRGCVKCSGNYKPTEQEALDKCTAICKVESYEPLGFVDGYKNNRSYFRYKCPKHGIQSVIYFKFVNNSTRCKGCWKERQKELDSGFYGYYPDRKDEVDYLYVLNFNNKFIKVGRSFDVDERIKNLRKPSESGIKSIKKLRIFTATHQEIYDLEQELHSELRERNFQHYVDWSTECFTSDSLSFLNMLLDKCGLEEVKLRYVSMCCKA